MTACDEGTEERATRNDGRGLRPGKLVGPFVLILYHPV